MSKYKKFYEEWMKYSSDYPDYNFEKLLTSKLKTTGDIYMLLHAAIEMEDSYTFRKALSFYPNAIQTALINMTDDNDETLLFTAVRTNNAALVQWVTMFPFDAGHKNKEGFTALNIAEDDLVAVRVRRLKAEQM